jgi:hypothetical protein
MALAGVAGLVAVATFLSWPAADPVTWENYERIKPGMSLADVEAIFGPHLTTVPSRDLDPDEYDFGERQWEVLAPELRGQEEVDTKLWWGGTGELEVLFARERVMTKTWYPRSKLARRAQRWWERWSLQSRRPPEL